MKFMQSYYTTSTPLAKPIIYGFNTSYIISFLKITKEIYQFPDC